MFTVDDGWLAAMIESEGCIDTRPPSPSSKHKAARLRIRIKMVDEDVIARVADLLGASYRRKKCPPWQDQFETEIAGKRAEALCRHLLPLFGERRTARILAGLEEAERTRAA